MLLEELLLRPVEDPVDRLLHLLPVLRMHEVEIGPRASDRPRGKAEERVHPGRPRDGAGDDFPLPRPHARRVEGEAQALLAVTDAGLPGQPVRHVAGGGHDVLSLVEVDDLRGEAAHPPLPRPGPEIHRHVADASLPAQPLHPLRALLRVRPEADLEGAPSHHFRPRVSERALEGLVDVEVDPVRERGDADGVGAAPEDLGEPLLGLRERALRILALRDVAGDGEQAFLALHLDPLRGHAAVGRPAILRPVRHLVAGETARRLQGVDETGAVGGVGPEAYFRRGPADHLGGRVAEDPLEAGAHVEVAPVLQPGEGHGVGAVPERLLELLLGEAEAGALREESAVLVFQEADDRAENEETEDEEVQEPEVDEVGVEAPGRDPDDEHRGLGDAGGAVENEGGREQAVAHRGRIGATAPDEAGRDERRPRPGRGVGARSARASSPGPADR